MAKSRAFGVQGFMGESDEATDSRLTRGYELAHAWSQTRTRRFEQRISDVPVAHRGAQRVGSAKRRSSCYHG